MKQLAAVLGVGQTRHRSKRTDVSIAGLCREAADRALRDAGLALSDIDAVVVGKAPDLFEGVMMPELYLADALGAADKPLLRVHTAGSVGGATGLVAASLVQAGLHSRVLAMAFEKQSESNAMWALSIAPPFSIQVVAGAGGYFAPHIRAYIRRSGAPPHIGALVAVKDRRNGALNPYAHLQQGDITLEKVQASPMLWDPVRYDETCPSSDGACAVIIGDSAAAEVASGPVAWIRATAMRSEPTMFAGKDHVNPQAGRDAAAALWRQAGITDPLNEIDVAEIYVPFSWYEPMWLENLGFAAPGEGWRMTEAGETAIGGRLPVNPSGGVLSSNPIGASGLLRFAEAALQVMGKAGAHQVEGARTALGHAYGGGSQFFSMWVVSSPRAYQWLRQRIEWLWQRLEKSQYAVTAIESGLGRGGWRGGRAAIWPGFTVRFASFVELYRGGFGLWGGPGGLGCPKITQKPLFTQVNGGMLRSAADYPRLKSICDARLTEVPRLTDRDSRCNAGARGDR